MIDNADLVNELHEKLDNFVKNLDESGQEVCREDLAGLRHALIDALNNTRALKVQRLLRKRSYNFLLNDVVPLIKQVIAKIDEERSLLENEMHGTQNFSEYELNKLQIFSYRTMLKETLQDMLTLIYKERTQLDETQPKSSHLDSSTIHFMK